MTKPITYHSPLSAILPVLKDDLGVRTMNCLRSIGDMEIGLFVELDRNKLLKYPNFSPLTATDAVNAIPKIRGYITKGSTWLDYMEDELSQLKEQAHIYEVLLQSMSDRLRSAEQTINKLKAINNEPE